MGGHPFRRDVPFQKPLPLVNEWGGIGSVARFKELRTDVLAGFQPAR